MCSERTGGIIEVSMRINDFSSEWMNCDRVSTFMARLVSQKSVDPMFHANLFSTALNELLEVVFFNHGPQGSFTCRVGRVGDVETIEIELPYDERTLNFYTDVLKTLDRPDVEELYQASLFEAGQVDARLGLLELAVDYKAKMSVLVAADQLTLRAEIALGWVQ